MTSRTLLADPVAWTPAAWKNAGDVTEAQRTPDLTKLIRQIVNRSDWQKGNALAFVISGSGKRNAKAFVSDAQDAPRLIIEPFDRPEANDANTSAHTIRLTFAELDADVRPGQRIFSVAINGQVVEEDLDVVAAAGGTRLGIVREYADVQLDDELRIRFIPKRGQPICNGIEVILEE
ncbi:MAG: malectin domain-containing carbohydrate-binding protein [Pirellulaceae bacterium]